MIASIAKSWLTMKQTPEAAAAYIEKLYDLNERPGIPELSRQNRTIHASFSSPTSRSKPSEITSIPPEKYSQYLKSQISPDSTEIGSK